MTRRLPRPATVAMLAACVAVAASACSRDDAPAADPAATTAAAATPSANDADAPAPATAAPTPAPGTDAVQLTDETSPVAAGAPLTARDLAGSFSADGQRLALQADGTYTFATRSPSANAEVTESGTWSLAADGKTLLLDPDAKSDPDRSFTLDSRDAVRGDGAPLVRSAD